MLKKSLAALMMFGLLLVGSPLFAAEKIVNGIDANFPPFAYIDQTGKAAGFDVEAMNWIAKEMGFEVTHTPIDWDGIITSLLTKKIDVIASGMSITEARAQQVNFSSPYWKIEQVLVVKKDSALTLDDIMKGQKALGVQQGTSEAKWLKDQAGPQGWNFDLRYYSSAPLAVEDVLNGRIAAAAMDDAPARDAESKKAVRILGAFGMHSEEFGYAVRKGDEELLTKLNQGLSKLMISPYWNELRQKYSLN